MNVGAGRFVDTGLPALVAANRETAAAAVVATATAIRSFDVTGV
jgi:hypothetical protein